MVTRMMTGIMRETRKTLFFALLVVVAGEPAAAQTQSGEPIVIPLRVDGGRLLVPVEAHDGAEFEFVLSLGNPTVLSESTAARLGDHPSLTMGGVPVQMEGFATLPDAELTSNGTTIVGMVGPTTLNQFDILVDVPGGRLVLKPIGSSMAWEGVSLSDPIRALVLHGALLGIDVEFNGREYESMLDLGVGTLLVNEPVRAQTHIGAEDQGTLKLGATTFTDLPVRTLDLPLFGGWDPDGDGFVVVGAPLFYDCAISLSWVHREIRTCVR